MKNTTLIAGLLLTLLVTPGCLEEKKNESSDNINNRKQEQLAKEAAVQVGLPAIVNFQEKKMAKEIIELRDTALTTYTYIVDMNGKLHKICNSIGYGLPYATQYTNPQKVGEYYRCNNCGASYVTTPQADPNGLFSPGSADGTWVMCLDPNNPKGKTMPLFVEPHIIVSPFEMKVN